MKLYRIRLGSFVLLAVILAASVFQPRAAIAQTEAAAKTVSYDTPVEGQITDAATEQDWALTAPGKDILKITVERTDGTLAPSVELRDANNQRVAGAEADDTYAKATIQSTSLPAGGAYIVAVTRYGGDATKTSGNYKLTVSLLGAGEDNPIVKAAPKPIQYDTEADGEITLGRWMESWTFNAPGKDAVTITATRKDGTLWPELILLDSSGNPVNRASSTSDGTKSIISRGQLPGPGAYTVVVKRYSDESGSTAGKYALTVSLDSAGADRPELAKPLGAVTLGTPVTGALTNAKWVDVYTLDAQSKDHLLMTATTADGNLMPEIVLLGANSQEIQTARADATYANAVLDVTLPGPGHYEVHVERQDADNGYTSGKYQLTVAVLGTGEDSPKFKTSTGEVKVGTPTMGTLTNDKWQDTYTLNLASGDPIDIIVKRTSGTLVPTFKLYGANNQELGGSGADNTYAMASTAQYTPPGPGQYTIVVSRTSDASGMTSGGYELDVNQGKKQ